MNTSLFNPTRDKYYAMILLRMNARSYTLSNYGYALGKVVVGFLPFTILFGLDRGVPLWLCLLASPARRWRWPPTPCGTMRSTAMSATRITSRR